MGGSLCRPNYYNEYESGYWCHYCRQFVLPLFLTDDQITCSRCHHGFVEQFRRRTPFVFIAFIEPAPTSGQRNDHGTHPAPTSGHQALSTVTVSQEHLPSECTVCLEEFEAGEVTCQMPCQHIFHCHCIRPWLELHSWCPICHFEMSVGDQVEQRPQRDDSTLGRNTNRWFPISVSWALRRVFGFFGLDYGTSRERAAS